LAKIVNLPEFYRPALERVAVMSDAEIEHLRLALLAIKITPNPQSLIRQVKDKLKVEIPLLSDIIQMLASLASSNDVCWSLGRGDCTRPSP